MLIKPQKLFKYLSVPAWKSSKHAFRKRTPIKRAGNLNFILKEGEWSSSHRWWDHHWEDSRRLEALVREEELNCASCKRPSFTWDARLDLSMTVTALPQLAHTESSSTSSVRTGREPRLIRLWESASQRSPTERASKLPSTSVTRSDGHL